MKTYIQKLNRGDVSELYLTATGDCTTAFEWAAGIAQSHGAQLLRQRAFVSKGEMSRWIDANKSAPGSQSMATNWLEAGDAREAGGVQFYAVGGQGDFQPLNLDNRFAGWCVGIDHQKWVINSAIQSNGDDGPTQARRCFETGEMLLKQAGMRLANVARTWIYMDDILSWYGPFNQVRNELFIDRGLLNRECRDASLVPASTGMGVRPVGGARISIEMLAVSSGIKRFAAAGKQRCAYEYGSAFARAAQVPTPAGSALYISGTAAIDEQGRTCHLDDPAGQIRMTIDNLLAVLKDARHDPRQVVEAIAYCKTPAVAEIFCSKWRNELPWPWIVVIGDVCRPDLLFEAEATAAG
jgi:enamine deaminase RidA (YjgF/YER057c/UK114 family)